MAVEPRRRPGGTMAATPAFVGRDEALAAVVNTLTHGPALILVEGEPGIGKTRLLHEVLTSRPDGIVLMAACPPLREPFPLGPVVDGLRRFGPQVGAVGLSALGGALRPLFPEWADRFPPALEALDDPGETRHRLFRALTELVEGLDVEVLVVEDAHWADTATLEWLLTLISVADRGMSIVTTYRPADVPDDSLLLRLTSRPPSGMDLLRLELEPLDVEQTRRLVGSMFGIDEVSEKFAAFLHERADGIPLAIEESVRLLRNRHDIVRHDGKWTRRLLEELEVPPTVRDSVLERVARLPAESRQVLEAAAVLAAPADEMLLSEVAGLDEHRGQHGVAAALASGLLREASPGRFAFRHVLDAQAVGEAAPASRWHRLHGRAAKALKTLQPAPVVRLARHFREAGDLEQWCRYAEAAADLALESGDDRTAVSFLLQLQTSLDHPVERKARLARKLGEAAFFGAAVLGELAVRVVGSLRDVLADGDLTPGDRGETRLHMGRMLWRIGEVSAGFEEIEAAVPELDHRPDLAIVAMVNLAMPIHPGWPASRHLRWLVRATELLPTVESSSARAAFARTRTSALLILGEESGWQAVAEMTETDPPSARDERLIAGSLLNVAEAAITWGRYTDMRRILDAAAEYIRRSDYQRLVNATRAVEAQLDWYTGAWDDLGAVAAELAEAEETRPLDQLQARQIRGLLELASGARARAEHRLRSVAEEYARLGVAEPLTVLAPGALARLRLADGAASEALELTGREMKMISRKGVWLWATDIAHVHLDALIGMGELDLAGELVERFAAGIAGRHAPAPAAAQVFCRAVVTGAKGDHDRAAALFAEAAAAWAVLPRPYDELLALERRGRCLLAAGDGDAGLAVLTDAERRLRTLGAKWDADRVARQLRRHGVEVSRAWRRGPRGYGGRLSPREKEVLALVARGMTNPEAAEVLFLSPKTVGRHLGTAMRKLGVSSRTAAAMAAAEAGLISAEDGARR